MEGRAWMDERGYLSEWGPDLFELLRLGLSEWVADLFEAVRLGWGSR